MEDNCGPFRRRYNKCKAGDVVEGHTHNFDHMTTFFSGKWHVEATLPNGTVQQRDVNNPDWLLIRADVLHTITCLEDGEYWCMYVHRNQDGEVVPYYDGWEAAYV